MISDRSSKNEVISNSLRQSGSKSRGVTKDFERLQKSFKNDNVVKSKNSNNRRQGKSTEFDRLLKSNDRQLTKRREQSLKRNRLFDNSKKSFDNQSRDSIRKSLGIKSKTPKNLDRNIKSVDQLLGKQKNRRDRKTMDRKTLFANNIKRGDMKGKLIPKFKMDSERRKDFVRDLNKSRRFDNGGIKLPPGEQGKRKGGRFGNWDRSKVDRFASHRWARNLDLKRQFDFRARGDIGRRMNLGRHLHDHGGWHNRRHLGLVHRDFRRNHFSSWYVGSWFFPRYCWTPRWSAWVDWCWWDHCYPIYDRRPYVCRPIICEPCPTWVYYETPVWNPLPIVTCGTWIDAPVVTEVVDSDLQILAVRFVDPGHSEQNLGPRYRIWFRNNSSADLTHGFNVVALATNVEQLDQNAPQAGMRVEEPIPTGEISSVDIRLPMQVNQMNLDEKGRQTPFNYLHVLVDSDQELTDSNRNNNGIMLNVRDILPVDPAAFAAEIDEVAPGELLNIAGEGFGPEPGEVTVIIDGKEWPTEIYGWYDLGVRFKVPEVTALTARQMEVIIIRGDGAAANPVEVELKEPSPALAVPPLPVIPPIPQ